VSATIGIVGQDDQRDVSAFYQVNDTFIRQEGAWHAISRQETRIASRTDPIFERIGKPNGKPRIVLFVQGSFCPHCMTQLMTFAKQLADKHYDVTVVSADTEDDLKKFPDVPFKLVADPKHVVFRKFGAYKGKPMHATVALDKRGKVVFSTAGNAPFMNADVVALWLDNAAVADGLQTAELKR
jgi:peroxiredoxin